MLKLPLWAGLILLAIAAALVSGAAALVYPPLGLALLGVGIGAFAWVGVDV